MNLEKLLQAANVPADKIPQALLSFDAAKATAKGLAKYKWNAPWATIPLVRGLPWEAVELAEKHDIYGNDDSINGDRSGWLLECGIGVRQPAPLGDTYLQFDDKTQQVVERPARELVYWGYKWVWWLYEKCGGKVHVRDNFVRWWWLGLRNRASRAFFLAGPETSPDVECWEGAHGRNSVQAWRMGDAWQLVTHTRILGPLGYRRNLGYKINNAVTGKARAMLIWTAWVPAWGEGLR